VARTINCTADAQRGTRKQALLSLKKFAEETAADASLSRNVKLVRLDRKQFAPPCFSGLDPPESHGPSFHLPLSCPYAPSHPHLQALLQHMLKPILKVYTDPTERCRLLAVELVQFLLNTHKPETELYLPYLIPVLTLRLAQKEIVETAEELRALLLQQLEDVIMLAKADLGVYIDEVVQVKIAVVDPLSSVTPDLVPKTPLSTAFSSRSPQMLVRALLDPFPEVKRRGCRCIGVSTAQPHVLFCAADAPFFPQNSPAHTQYAPPLFTSDFGP
jgi:hypothetical protein